MGIGGALGVLAGGLAATYGALRVGGVIASAGLDRFGADFLATGGAALPVIDSVAEAVGPIAAAGKPAFGLGYARGYCIKSYPNINSWGALNAFWQGSLLAAHFIDGIWPTQ